MILDFGLWILEFKEGDKKNISHRAHPPSLSELWRAKQSAQRIIDHHRDTEITENLFLFPESGDADSGNPLSTACS